MSSSRLPGKVLADIGGRPALSWLLDRLRRCRTLDGIVLATSTNPADDLLARWAEEVGVACFRGSEDDVLGRVVGAQESQQSDIVVEVTGDCILTDPEIIDLGVDTFFANTCDVVTNCGRTLSFPMGVYVQVFPLHLLREVANDVADPAVREHVSLYFYEHTERYRVIELVAPARWRFPNLRFQLDYPEDLSFLREVHGRLARRHGAGFGLEEVVALLRDEPHLAAINAHCEERAAR